MTGNAALDLLAEIGEAARAAKMTPLAVMGDDLFAQDGVPAFFARWFSISAKDLGIRRSVGEHLATMREYAEAKAESATDEAMSRARWEIALAVGLLENVAKSGGRYGSLSGAGNEARFKERVRALRRAFDALRDARAVLGR